MAERLPLTLHAYHLLTAAAVPLADGLLRYRLKRGKEHDERLPERRGESRSRGRTGRWSGCTAPASAN